MKWWHQYWPIFVLYSLDAYINMVEIASLHVFINWCYLHQDAGKTYSGILKIRSTRSIQRQPYPRIWKRILERLSGYERIIKEDHQHCLFDKREASYDKPSSCKKRWETFLWKTSNSKSSHFTIHYWGDSS